MNNTVELLGHYGGDLTHAMSAWTSTKRDITPERLERIPDLLINKLMGLKGEECEYCGNKIDSDHGPPHTSPFEKSALHFLVTTDVATHIHIIKHRIGVSGTAWLLRQRGVFLVLRVLALRQSVSTMIQEGTRSTTWTRLADCLLNCSTTIAMMTFYSL